MKILNDSEHRIFLSAMSREREICSMREFWDEDGANKLLAICDSIERKVNAVETTRHGHWIPRTFEEVMNGDWIVLRDWQGNGFECSHCARLIAENEMPYKFKYCPNCGAKMDEVSV